MNQKAIAAVTVVVLGSMLGVIGYFHVRTLSFLSGQPRYRRFFMTSLIESVIFKLETTL